VVETRGRAPARQKRATNIKSGGLSWGRARSLFYVFVGGGVEEKRFSQVSGFADRRLKLPDDPFNAGNRRIEILVQADQG
ncbi:MotB family protein, partial [Rhizobium sp. SEMIA 4085]|nr:MotB family protein [Rhizobium sp. SEMIA 4085]